MIRLCSNFSATSSTSETSASADVDKGILSSNDVVYIKSEWIIGSKGLIHHSRDTLLKFFSLPEINLTNAVRSIGCDAFRDSLPMADCTRSSCLSSGPWVGLPKVSYITHDQVPCSEIHCCWNVGDSLLLFLLHTVLLPSLPHLNMA